MSESKLDFSVRSIPDSWAAAAEDAPKPPDDVRVGQSGFHRLPTGTRPDLVTGTLTGIAMTVIAGTAWYLNGVNGVFTGTAADFVMSILLGVLIAIAVRLGAGPSGPELRVGVGAALFVTTILSVAFAVTREEFTALNRRSPSFGEVEDLVTAYYLSRFTIIAAWILGLVVMSYMTFALKHRRR
jgi:hypothetical protein